MSNTTIELQNLERRGRPSNMVGIVGIDLAIQRSSLHSAQADGSVTYRRTPSRLKRLRQRGVLFSKVNPRTERLREEVIAKDCPRGGRQRPSSRGSEADAGGGHPANRHGPVPIMRLGGWPGVIVLRHPALVLRSDRRAIGLDAGRWLRRAKTPANLAPRCSG